MPPVPPLNRRSLLRGAGALVGATSVSGCSGLLSSSSGSSDSSYTNWLFDPSERTDRVWFSTVRHADLLSFDELSADRNRKIGGIPATSIDRELRVRTGSGPADKVYEGSFDAETIRSAYGVSGSSPYQRIDDYAGYERYSTGDPGAGLAIRDGTAIFAMPDLVERYVDAHAGDETRLVDAHDHVATAIDRLGESHSISCSAKFDPAARDGLLEENQLAGGSAALVEGERTTITSVALFVDAESATESAIRQDVPNEPDVQDVTVETDGRIVTGTYTRDTSKL